MLKNTDSVLRNSLYSPRIVARYPTCSPKDPLGTEFPLFRKYLPDPVQTTQILRIPFPARITTLHVSILTTGVTEYSLDPAVLWVTSSGTVETFFITPYLYRTILYGRGTIWQQNPQYIAWSYWHELNWLQYLVRSYRHELNWTTRIFTTGLPDTTHTAIHRWKSYRQNK